MSTDDARSGPAGRIFFTFSQAMHIIHKFFNALNSSWLNAEAVVDGWWTVAPLSELLILVLIRPT